MNSPRRISWLLGRQGRMLAGEQVSVLGLACKRNSRLFLWSSGLRPISIREILYILDGGRRGMRTGLRNRSHPSSSTACRALGDRQDKNLRAVHKIVLSAANLVLIFSNILQAWKSPCTTKAFLQSSPIVTWDRAIFRSRRWIGGISHMLLFYTIWYIFWPAIYLESFQSSLCPAVRLELVAIYLQNYSIHPSSIAKVGWYTTAAEAAQTPTP